VFWWGNLKERGYFEDPVLKGRITLKWIFKECNEISWTGLIRVRIRTVGPSLAFAVLDVQDS